MSKLSLFLILSWWAAVLPARSQTNSIIPTVTKAMGDVGGKLFGRTPDPARTRHYYIAAESQPWDFAPLGRDVVCGQPLPPTTLLHHTSIKSRYVAYTDASFTHRAIEDPSLGILGPVLRGMVGQNLAVTFWNRTDIPLSMHPHGLKYDKDSEGSYYQPAPGLGAAVAPGAKFTYVWQVDASAGPLPAEPSSKAWLYHSHVRGDEEVNLGLVGFIIVTDPRRARADGTPMDVDREFGTLFMIFNENGYDTEVDEAVETGVEQPLAPVGAAPPKTWAQLQQLREEGQRYAINGRIFGNLGGLEMNAGERVRWYLFGLGSESDFHTAHWHGLRVVENGRSTDVIELMPGSMKVVDLLADNPGAWLFHCHVAEHMMGGMFARVTVHATNNPSTRRAPRTAFLGLTSKQQSLRITSAGATVDFAADARQPCEITITGEAAVPEAFAIFNHPVRIQLGGQSITFKPGRKGVDENLAGSFRVADIDKKPNEKGIIYDGRLKFVLTLSGRASLHELIAAGLPANEKRVVEVGVPLSFETGAVSYHTIVPLKTVPR